MRSDKEIELLILISDLRREIIHLQQYIEELEAELEEGINEVGQI